MQDINKGFFPMRGEQYLQDGLLNLMDAIETNFDDCSNLEMLEIGSYVGESSKIFASKFKKVTCVDPFKDDYDPDDLACHFAPFEAVYQKFIENTKDFENIELVRDFSDNALCDLLKDKKFDFIYIDGLHTYNQVCKDIDNSIPLLRPQKGKILIGGHDYHFRWNEVVDAVNQKLGEPDFTFIDTSWLKIIYK